MKKCVICNGEMDEQGKVVCIACYRKDKEKAIKAMMEVILYDKR